MSEGTFNRLRMIGNIGGPILVVLAVLLANPEVEDSIKKAVVGIHFAAVVIIVALGFIDFKKKRKR